jgi:acetyl esterase/lipase
MPPNIVRNMKTILAALLAACLSILPGWSQTNSVRRTQDVIYGRKFGMALTMDVFQPPKPNGAAVMFIASGGWFSSHDAVSQVAYQPLLDHGYTVFAVVHGSQPRFIIPEIVQDIHRAARFIRHNAATYGVDPQRLGVMGGSAGGHLSLMLGTQAMNEAMIRSKDPIDHESSAVQCIACFYPPTDFLNYGATGVEAEGIGTLKDFRPAFGPESETEAGRQKIGHEFSPIYYLSSNLPPTLIFHGDADKLVPIQQSQIFADRAKEVGATVKLITKPCRVHGWPDWISTDMPVAADWFDAHIGAPGRNAVKCHFDSIEALHENKLVHRDGGTGVPDGPPTPR